MFTTNARVGPENLPLTPFGCVTREDAKINRAGLLVSAPNKEMHRSNYNQCLESYFII